MHGGRQEQQRKLWSDGETNDLIEAWSNEVIQVALEMPKHRNKATKSTRHCS
jgi:hypothetical protein